MRRFSLTTLAVAAALGATALPALAVTCYEVIDRTNSVIFRDTSTPVDLSPAGAAARDAMRARGQQLVIFDTDTCIVLGRTTPTGAKTLSVDEIVAEYQGFAGPSSNVQWSRRVGGGPDPTLGGSPRGRTYGSY